MGFNNAGVDALARRLRRVHPGPMPIGVNLGKGWETPLERAADDYAAVAERVADRCDFLVVNVSSPNTPGLRELESPQQLRSLLARLRGARLPPLLVKLSPDLAESEAAALGTTAAEAGAAGLVLTNTTVDYALLPGAGPPGGLSGAVLRERSFASLRAVARELAGRLLLVSVGGIDSGAEAYRRLRAGASLIELYTGLVYRGPGLARRLHRELVLHLERDGARSLREVIGADVGR
jgi:dihydroorotate dehydrogenase